MHFVVAWQVDDASPEREEEIRLGLESAFDLDEVEVVQVLDRVYAVRVMGNGVMERVQVALLESARSQPERVRLMISPLMSRGVYTGRLGDEAVRGLRRIVD